MSDRPKTAEESANMLFEQGRRSRLYMIVGIVAIFLVLVVQFIFNSDGAKTTKEVAQAQAELRITVVQNQKEVDRKFEKYDATIQSILQIAMSTAAATSANAAAVGQMQQVLFETKIKSVGTLPPATKGP